MISYLGFLLLFVCIPIAALAFGLRRSIRLDHLARLGVIAVIAVVYTTPWDNYLVATRVWYYDPALVLGITLGYVPIEEYSFFVLQTLMTGLFALWLWRRFYPGDLKR